ncbi:glutathione transferase GstA [Bradyrhizobium sp. CCBAU 53351]|uniref:glutathione transferase GstA n=1 Tax=Bradyrhizobium sp. CCBAU 53351 TaxID=1325114 RepID=UPI001886EB66|nr:glutathione transferase GstA [Bradyrhizobium sp. CCBAU 53351]QOZ78771.1 glutathione transferase GstA [Bradyrhizobium sp. CCBAU 53351]
MKLYYSAGSCGLASQIALREAGQRFDLVAVDFRTKTTSEGDYLQVTPKGFVPALKLDDGDVITEGAVILQWIADRDPDAGLLPPFGTRQRYEALEWLNFVATDLHKNFAVMFSPVLDADSKARFAEKNLIGKFQYVDRHLSTRDYVLGGKFCVADGYLYNVLCWPGRVNLDATGYASIRNFMARMEQRPSVRASLKAEGLLS